jgi:hypothetical protein
MQGGTVSRWGNVAGWWAAALATIAVSLLFPTNIPIIDLELASTAQTAAELIRHWIADGALGDAQRSVLIDYLFIPLYAATLFFGVLWASRVYVTAPIRGLGRAIAPLVPLAGILDALENIGLLKMLAVRPEEITGAWPAWTAALAYVKFFAVAVASLYLVGGAFTRAWQWLRSRLKNAPPDWVELMRTSDLRESQHWKPGPAPPWMADEWKPTPQRIGVSCSGGGIRSAAYNLGALQALQSAGKLQKARYMTAVSGGSYMAGAWAILNKESDKPLDPPAFASTSPEEDYLRNHSSYLVPNTRGLLWALCRFLLGAAANFLFLFLLILVVARPLGWAIVSRYVHPEIASVRVGAAIHVSGAMWLAIIVGFSIAVIAAFMSVLVRWSTKVENLFLKPAKLAFMLAAALFVFLVAFPWTVRTVPSFLASPGTYLPFGGVTRNPREAFNIAGLIQALGLGATLLAALKAFLSKNKSTLLMLAASAIPWLVIFLGMVMVAYSGAVSDKDFVVGLPGGFEITRQLALWLVAVFGLALFYLIADQTTWSLHPFYKRRLASAFALRRHAPDADGHAVGEVHYDTELQISKYPKPSVAGPQLVVCAAANVSDEGLTPVGRRSVSYTFSSTEIGGPGVGWVRPEAMEQALSEVRGREDVTLMAAMAISGAAVSPAMGKLKQSRIGSLLAFVNARLGVWLPSLRWIGEFRDRDIPWRDRPHATHMLKELVHSYRSGERFVYVSDGGHWENLGLVELLRRGCTEIYCFDASGDKVDTFTTVGQAIAIARTEVEVEIVIDLHQDAPGDEPPLDDEDDKKLSRRERKKAEKIKRDPRLAKYDHWTGILRYKDGTLGRIVVVKLAVTKDTPFDVRAYAAVDPKFPTHSTVDQLFNHEKFEAYRALGEASCWNALHAMQKPFGLFATSRGGG